MSKTTNLLLALVFLVRPFSTFACGNEYYKTAEMPLVAKQLDLRWLLNFARDYELPYWSHGFGENIIEKRNELLSRITGNNQVLSVAFPVEWSVLDRALQRNTDYKLLSDFAWYELRVGDKRNAVRLLERLYEKYPNEYNVVANLGTAYEVMGRNPEALGLLKKAVAINPQSHYGSEWIHVNILAQKVKATPDYKQIIDLGAGNDYPQWLSGQVYNKKIPADSLMVQLAYQLHERIGFVAPPDLIVAQLVLDFADLAAIARSQQAAKAFYDYAVSYDSTLAVTAQQRIEASPSKVLSAAKKKSSGRNYGIYAGLAVILVGGLSWFLFGRKKVSH